MVVLPFLRKNIWATKSKRNSNTGVQYVKYVLYKYRLCTGYYCTVLSTESRQKATVLSTASRLSTYIPVLISTVQALQVRRTVRTSTDLRTRYCTIYSYCIEVNWNVVTFCTMFLWYIFSWKSVVHVVVLITEKWDSRKRSLSDLVIGGWLRTRIAARIL